MRIADDRHFDRPFDSAAAVAERRRRFRSAARCCARGSKLSFLKRARAYNTNNDAHGGDGNLRALAVIVCALARTLHIDVSRSRYKATAASIGRSVRRRHL